MCLKAMPGMETTPFPGEYTIGTGWVSTPILPLGDWQRFCVIPVTQEQLKNFEEKGVILYEVE